MASKQAVRRKSPATAAAPIRVKRVPKGKRPQYFSDPAIDKLLWATVTLAQELAVTRDRLDAVERLLTAARVLKPGAVDAYVPPPAVVTERDVARTAFIARILRVVEAELEEATGKGNPRTQDEVIAAVSS